VSDLDAFQAHNQLRFTNSSLLQQALTHSSYTNEHLDEALADNERLEFLGDAVLSFLSGDLLFRRFPDLPEGDLTRLRAALVRTESLAEIARICRVGPALLLGRGEAQSGGRARLTILCAAFEAVIGALYLDQGLAAVRAFAGPYLEDRLTVVLAESLDHDPRSRLQEWSQAQLGATPIYQLVEASGPDHAKRFIVEVLIDGQTAGRGAGHSKQAAALAAAQVALEAVRAGRFPHLPDSAADELDIPF